MERKMGGWGLIDNVRMLQLLSITFIWMTLCACVSVLGSCHRHAKTFVNTCVFCLQTGRGAGKPTLSAVRIDPEPRARQRSGEGLSGHWA